MHQGVVSDTRTAFELRAKPDVPLRRDFESREFPHATTSLQLY